MNTIQSQWESFKEQAMPGTASLTQKIEMEKAFYAGAFSVLILMLNIGGDDISEEAGVQMLETLHEECRQFKERILNGYIG
jgi:hypothetical protein